jgi:AraC-like DNA-binding protein
MPALQADESTRRKSLCSHLSFQTADVPPPGKENSWPSYMCRLNFVTQMYQYGIDFGEHVGPLSIKSVAAGSEVYETDGVRRLVDPGSYLILNHGQRYSSAIDSDCLTDSFCVWFRPGFTDGVHASLSTTNEALLDDPSSISPMTFVDRLYPHDDVVSPVLQRMHRAFVEGHSTREWLEEQFHFLAEGMVRSHQRVTAEIESVLAARQSTRVETYRRLHRAKDYLESNLTAPVALNDLAAVAWLSPHHFLRQFQQLFGESPRQYQTRRRMEKARRLLLKTDQQVTDICFSLGFESLGSFSWLFRKLHGVPPSQFRANHRGVAHEIGKREEVENSLSR